MKDAFLKELNVGDLVYTDSVEFHSREFIKYEIIKFTNKNVVIQKLNSKRAKPIYKKPHEVISIMDFIQNHPEVFI